MIWISSDRDDRRIFWGRKILASIFLGIQNLCFSFHVISFKVFWKFLCLGNSARDFWGLKFWSRDFLGGFFGSPRDFFLVLIFAPIQSSPSLEIWSTPLIHIFFISLFGRTLFITCKI